MANPKRTYRKEGTKLTLSFDYNTDIVSSIKENVIWKDRTYDPIGKQWVIQLNVSNQNTVKEIIDKYLFLPIENSSDQLSDESNINSYLKQKSRLNQLKSYRTEVDKIQSSIKPRLFQYEGIDYMCSWPKMINGDDMGLGKSVETIFSAEVMNRFPCLLICPSSTKYQWKELWLKVNPERTLSIIDSGGEQDDWTADVVIINYDLLGKMEKYEKEGEEKTKVILKYKELSTVKWNYVVIDEIHFLKHSKAIRSQAAKLIVKGIGNVHGLTGTLVENKPVEIVNPLMLIGVFQDVFSNWNSFTTRYCDSKKTRFGLDVSGSSHTIELNRLLRETCYIRREKREILKDLPDIQFSVLDIDITNKKEYRKAEDMFIDYLTENYSKVVVDSAMMAEFLVQRNYLRQLSVKGKMKGIIEWLEDFAEQSTEKMLVVGNYSEPLQQLSSHFGAQLIDGSRSAFQKRDIIKQWNTSKQQFLFGNIQAIGTGTDGLQENCSIMSIIDLSDKASTIDQLVSRLERIGQKNAISIYYLLNKETIDMKLWDAIETKRKIMKAINSGIKVELTDVNSLIVKNYLKRL